MKLLERWPLYAQWVVVWLVDRVFFFLCQFWKK